eukprot:TRINITY_DN1147_c0_g6_i1.p1 TRINITY_DN1147_c0_g6~~TRINITY_DN1147_c0_g6_i1.p1  ORF type:complete len:155 (+),score=9.65 TRINITY_DN1147_c0_g6_i1:57-467(+)
MKKPSEVSDKPTNVLPTGGLGTRPVLGGRVANRQGFRSSMDAPMFSSFSSTNVFEPHKVQVSSRPAALPSLKVVNRAPIDQSPPLLQPGNRKLLDALNAPTKLLPSVHPERSVVHFVSLPPLGQPFAFNSEEATES